MFRMYYMGLINEMSVAVELDHIETAEKGCLVLPKMDQLKIEAIPQRVSTSLHRHKITSCPTFAKYAIKNKLLFIRSGDT